jgi:outer membrane protein
VEGEGICQGCSSPSHRHISQGKKGGVMKKVFFLILGLSMVLFFQSSQAASQPAKVGVMDLDKFQKTSKAFQTTAAAMKKKFEELQKKLDDERAAVTKLEEDFKKQSMMLSLDAQEGKQRELEKKRRYYKYLYEDSTQEMKDTEMEAIKKIMKELEKIVEKIGEQEGFTVILEKRTLGLVYYNKAVDVTDRVVEAYDKVHQ